MDSALRRLLAALSDRTALRRSISIVCAIVFLAVGFSHTIQHYDGTVSLAAVQETVGVTGDSPDSSKKATIAIEHCFACTMSAMPVSGQSLPTAEGEAEPAASPPSGIRPHPPATEIRPPITVI